MAVPASCTHHGCLAPAASCTPPPPGRLRARFERVPTVNPADVEFDLQQLSNSKLVKSRHVRRTLVDRLWPHLLQLREEEEQVGAGRGGKGWSWLTGWGKW